MGRGEDGNVEVALIYLLKRSLDPVLGKTTGRQREEMTIKREDKTLGEIEIEYLHPSHPSKLIKIMLH